MLLNPTTSTEDKGNKDKGTEVEGSRSRAEVLDQFPACGSDIERQQRFGAVFTMWKIKREKYIQFNMLLLLYFWLKLDNIILVGKRMILVSKPTLGGR